MHKKKLTQYDWPGNIRELENVIHHSLLVSKNHQINASDFHLSRSRNTTLMANSNETSAIENTEQAFDRLFNEYDGDVYELVQRLLFRRAYHYCGYNQVHTANLLGLSRNITRAQLIRIGELVVNKRTPHDLNPHFSPIQSAS